MSNIIHMFFSVLAPVAVVFYAAETYGNRTKSYIAQDATKHVYKPDGYKFKISNSICSEYTSNPISKSFCEHMFLRNYYAFMSNAKKTSEPPQNVNHRQSMATFIKSEAVKRGIIDDDDDAW
jgi:hypothetical protein